MAKTLLNLTNEVLKKVDVLDEDSGLLTSLKDSARQTYIDLAVQTANEVIDELYSVSEHTKPLQLKEAAITLVAGTQEYALHSDLITLRDEFQLVNEANNHFINILPEGGYRALIHGDLDQDDTGLPDLCAINPINGRLWLNRAPSAVDAGRVYKYRFEKDLELCEPDDEVPFTNPVFRAVVPAVAELWRRYRHKEFSQSLFDRSLGRAAGLLSKTPARFSWQPRRGIQNQTDPMQSA